MSQRYVTGKRGPENSESLRPIPSEVVAYLDQKAEVLLGSRQVFITSMKAEFLAKL